ncbi:hypothetical protein PVK06_001465 [Gossypium arboreum]|uniref:Uncharacterized protein n=1 Tax=Gossypium arboreum TaxID=29729 RepID=A0ABR0R125_GOSAR|nr:hypothetical protein PVK06_001465 [Gossypium arboreum]
MESAKVAETLRLIKDKVGFNCLFPVSHFVLSFKDIIGRWLKNYFELKKGLGS